jgi:hypothetical protein
MEGETMKHEPLGQYAELEAVKKRIRALTEKKVDRGCTEQEAISAMEKVGELLSQFNLTIDQVYLSASPCQLYSFKVGDKQSPPIAGVALSLGDLFGCIAWQSRYGETLGANGKYRPSLVGDGCYLNFYGKADDIEMLKFMADVIWKAAETELAHYKATDPDYLAGEGGASLGRRSLSVDFQHGFVNRICERLRAMERANAENDPVVPNAPGSQGGTSLIVFKTQLVKTAYEDAGLPRLRTRSRRAGYGSSAYDAGRAAGGRVGLGGSTPRIGRAGS